MPRTKNTITIPKEHYEEIIGRLEVISQEITLIKNEQLSRRHLDEIIIDDHKMLMGNGKPGFLALRDKVLSWDGKITALSILMLGNVLWQIVEKAL